MRELAVKGQSSTFARLAHELGSSSFATANPKVADVYDSFFTMLKRKGRRDEYIYKTALTHRILLGRHSLRTACMLSEFRAGDCKADIAILNGTTTVYEVKSERDSLTRLERQIGSYRKVFASVFVIAGENHVATILKSTPSDVGVLKLDSRGYISTSRESVDLPGRICPATVFDALRTNEAKSILTETGIAVPDVPNTRLREELRHRFEKLRPEIVHQGMLRTLKKTRNMQPLADLVSKLPSSLQAAALSVRLRKADHERLVNAVNTPLHLALTWA